MLKALYSKKEFLVAVPVSLQTLNRRIKSGDIRTIKYGTRVFIPAEEVQKIANPQQSQQSSQAAMCAA